MRNKTKELSANSQAIYEKRLAQMSEMDIKFDGSVGIRAIIKKLKDMEYADGTIIQYLSAILWKLNNTPDTNYKQKKLINSLSRKNSQLGVKRNKFYDKNILSKKEQEKFIKWTDVMKVYTEVSNNKNLSSSNYLEYVILSVYCNNILGVRRIKDYSNMIVSSQIVNDDNNHYVRSTKPVFVFNNYKTKDFYGQQVLKIDGTLNKILNDYIDKYTINGSLLGLSEDALKKRLAGIFIRYVDRNVSVNILRKSFISHFLSVPRNDRDKKELARTVGHNILTQSSYNKLNKVPDIDIIEDVPKEIKLGRKPSGLNAEEKALARKNYLKKWKEDNKDKISEHNKKYYSKD